MNGSRSEQKWRRSRQFLRVSWIRRRRLSTVLFHLFSVSQTFCSKDVCTRSLWRRLIWQMHSCNACAMILEVYFAAHLRLCQRKIARVIQNLNAFETRCNVTIAYLDFASDFSLIIFVRNIRSKKKHNHGLGFFPKQSLDLNQWGRRRYGWYGICHTNIWKLMQ